MVDIAALADEITVNPLTRAAYTPWASQADDVRITADLSTVYRDGPVPSLEAGEAIFASTKWPQFREKADARVETREVVGDVSTITIVYSNPYMRTFVDAALSLGGAGIDWDFSDAGFWGALTANCVTEGSMGAAVRTALLALRENRLTRSQELFGSTVKEVDVRDARAL